MRDAVAWWLVGLVLVLAAAGCSRAVAGTPSAAPPRAVAPTVSGAVTAAGPARDPTGLEGDVLADECLLDARQLTALLGEPVGRPAQAPVRRDDGSRSSSCYAAAAQGPPVPVVAINVYRVRDGTPAGFVRGAGGRALAGVGRGAAVLDTAAGPTLQVATTRLLVTVAVPGRGPPDGAWRVAARRALARLPR